MEEYCMYLRKSRADAEAEARGEGETLARHEKHLLDLAFKMGINISAIYREIVSGETIAQRPEIQELIQDVEAGKWAGVLVMEIERLARGDTVDQGIIAQTFKYAGTKIITPTKTYDPNNEFDEEYFEFGLFMSRREYKTINRRQQTGRKDSVKEGKFIGNIPPYGYERMKLEKEKGFSLIPHPEQAPIIQMIFDLYVNQGLGTGLIAKKLNSLGIPTARNSLWTVATINGIIRNPVYYGVIAWRRRPEKRTRVKGIVKKSRPRVASEEWLVADGRHEPIVSKELWDKAQETLQTRSHPPAPAGIIASSLAGLIRCEFCGRLMIRRPYSRNQAPSLICVTPLCKNISSSFELVEQQILEGLKKWLQEYKAQWELTISNNEVNAEQSLLAAKEQIVKSLQTKLGKLKNQNNNLHDLVEQGLYTIEVFMERSQVLKKRMEEAEQSLSEAIEELKLEEKRQHAKVDIIPNIEHVLDVYPRTEEPAMRNELLKTVLEVCTYKKTVRGHWSRPDSMRMFDLKLYPKLPKN